MDNKDNLVGIKHYNLHFKIQPDNGVFNVYGTMTIENKSDYVCNEIPIVLYHQLEVKKVKDINNKDLNFTQEKIELKDEENYYVNYILIKLDDILKPNGNMNLYIEYEGSINGYSHLMAYIKDKIDKDFSIIRPDCHAYPIAAQPCYESISKSYENTFTYNLSIDVPYNYIAGCGGVLKDIVRRENRIIFTYVCDSPTWRFDIGAAKYCIVEDKAMNLIIFVFSEHKVNAENIVKKEIKRAFDFFTAAFGEYCKNDYFTVIEIKESYGSQAGDNYIMMEEHGFSGDSKNLTHLYHEIGHRWNVKAKYNVQKTRFFDEAFASYFETLAIKKFYGEKAFTDKMELYRKSFIKSVETDKINYDTPICDYWKYEIGHNSYTKGPWALYALNSIVGDENFNRIIKTFLNKYRYKKVDFKDFEETVREVYNGNLDSFFNCWIYGIESSKLLCKSDKLLCEKFSI